MKQWNTNKRLQRKRQLQCPQLSLSLRRLIYMFPQICHHFRQWQNFLDENSRYHLNSSAWMGKVWLWHKTINICWPGELFIPFNFLSLFTCCGATPLLSTMPFQVASSFSPCELSFDKTQTVESFPRKSSVSFLERNSIFRKSSLLEKKPNKPLQVRIFTWVFSVLKEASGICPESEGFWFWVFSWLPLKSRLYL